MIVVGLLNALHYWWTTTWYQRSIIDREKNIAIMARRLKELQAAYEELHSLYMRDKPLMTPEMRHFMDDHVAKCEWVVRNYEQRLLQCQAKLAEFRAWVKLVYMTE